MKNWKSINETADYLKVSTATIHNWIKANYLIYNAYYGIDYNSILHFKQNISGVEKLNKRANKSELDIHSPQSVFEYIQRNIHKENIADIYQD